MANDFYNHGSYPTTGSVATSAALRAELDSVAAGFDKMPPLTGNQGKVIKVNASGTGLEAVTVGAITVTSQVLKGDTVGGAMAATPAADYIAGTGATTGAAQIPVGTTAERPTPATGQARFNSTTTGFEGYNGTAWRGLGEKTSNTGSAILPAGTTAQRDGSPDAGYFRFNVTLGRFEGYNGTVWGSVGGATGGGPDALLYENDQTMTTSYTITTGKNAMSAGPITINDGVTMTVPDGSVWSIV